MSESEVNQRKRSVSPPVSKPKVRSISPQQQEIRNKAALAMRNKNKKQVDFFDKYAYHIVIGAFVAVCVLAFGSTLFKSNKKLSSISVIDLDDIESHNSQGYSHQLGSNEFFQNWMLSDAKYILNNHLTFKNQMAKCATSEDQTIIPERYNFYEAYPNCAHPVYNQGNCSSSYAIAATSAVSDRVCKQRGDKFTEQLSPQAPLSCDKQKNFGCGGGSVSRVLDFGRKFGFVTRQCMDFEGKDVDLDCETILGQCEKYRVEDYCVSSEAEKIQREIYKNGPIISVIPVYKDFLIYKQGVYQVIEGNSRFQAGHAIKIIGWDKNEQGQSYWIIENSWGETWGYNGFGHIGIGQPSLQIEDFVIAPIIEDFVEENKVEQSQSYDSQEPVVTNID